MELEQWIREDIKKFVKKHEPARTQELNVRHEDLGIITNRDYETLIKDALKSHRFAHATELFKELKQRFLATPLEHQSERKSYYRMMQKCYKHIYDYVADQHKTARILTQLSQNQDPFNSSVKPVDLSAQRPADAGMAPSIEQLMIQQPVQIPSMPELDDGSQKELGLIPTPTQTSQARPPAPKVPPPKPQETEKPQTKMAPPKKRNVLEELFEKEKLDIKNKHLDDGDAKVQSHEPTSWNPPSAVVGDAPDKPRNEQDESADELNEVLAVEEPSLDLDDRQVRLAAAQALAKQAKEMLSEDTIEEATEKLLEAQFELDRAGGDAQTQNQISELQDMVGALLKPQHPTPKDHEVFSSTYMRGLQALAAGDYTSARDFFLQRVQQAPRDRAAQIRLAECMEALNGKAA